MFGIVPFAGRNNLAREEDGFDRLFNWMNQPLSSIFSDTGFSGKSFNVDVKDNGSSYELKAELPGFTKEDVHLSYQDNYLTISTRKEESKDEKDDQGNYIRRERYCGSMSRSFYIDNIDENKCNAEFKDGILTITMEKKDAAQIEASHEIPIH
ncbi:MAG: Hsp20/alpha crystallin family protein [Anaerovibrio sp.]|uniref:Hsp20/alpha crystallin family protein n=1 Tax=Anaerovibrio sp. TaxID=1872532 RepID=UPI0025E7888B|nr:Hsp20/alpha crystallin family protein [Anaerovibrio sp.]MCR5175587.1 Hsp20/alpha crystallin family protein [Anaerovibrio sp.]